MTTVPESNRMILKAALKRIRIASNDRSVAGLVRFANEVLDYDIEDLIMMNSDKQTTNELPLH